ncbi:MAG: hypothetical protein HRT69_18145 [Flavobacteriaceae bacterium]|nr:hypothetical protein [Flavobacteriaceae bacterium]
MTDCETAQTITQMNAVSYNAANSSDSNYSELCTDYKNALVAQIASCGDDSGALQNTVNSLGDCSDTDTSNSTVSHDALMTANLNGVQYDNLVPFYYPYLHNAVLVQVDNYGNKMLLIQGNSAPTSGGAIEINIHLREDNWAIGTYPLYSDSSSGTKINPIDLTNGYQTYYVDNSGSITITTFDTVSRIVEGTFQYSYMHSTNSGEIGPFNCVNGTFRYSLDNEYFD